MLAGSRHADGSGSVGGGTCRHTATRLQHRMRPEIESTKADYRHCKPGELLCADVAEVSRDGSDSLIIDQAWQPVRRSTIASFLIQCQQDGPPTYPATAY